MQRQSDPRIEQARNGSPTLIMAGRYVHSRHDPEREAARAVQDLARRDPPAVVILGMGLGYHAAELIARTSSRIVIYEPSADVRRLALQEGPLAERDLSNRVTVVGTPAELERILPLHAAAGFQTLELPALRAYDSRVAAARSVVEAFASRLDINRNTLSRFGRLWVRNLCRNLDHLAGARGVQELTGSMDGLPAVLLAAGPTLDSILPSLPEIARRCLVIAVDTAVSPAMEMGVEPDFAVVVDPQYWNARHLDRVGPSHTLLVSEASAHPFVFRHFRAPVYLCSSLFPLGRSFESLLGAFGTLGAGGSVSTSAWDLARLLGASSVHTAGLDLGFPHGRTHCRSSFFEELALVLANRLEPAEKVIFRYTWNADPELVPANDGGTLLSDRRMEIYRRWFASHLGLPGAPATAALTRGGAAVEGLGLTTIEELLALPDRREEIMSRLSTIGRTTGRERLLERRERLHAHAGELRDQLHDLSRLAAEAGAAVAGIRRRHEAGQGVDFSLLAPLDERISGHRAGGLGSFLIQDAIARVNAGYGSANMAEQIEASAQIYDGLADAARFHADQLDQAATHLPGGSATARR